MTTKSLLPVEFFPTSVRAGNDGSKVFRMQNMILRGEGREAYAETYGGSLDLGEDIATSVITGTVSCTAANLVVTGAGTAFKTELHIGQFLLVYGGAPSLTIPLVVDEIISDTSMRVCRAPYATTAGATCTRLPVIFEVNKKRGTLLRGNAIESDLGTILAVGDGTLRLNGTALSGSSLAATRSPKIAIFDNATGNYSVYTLGMATPATLTAANGPAGTKNMQAGTYSIRAVPARKATNGYNNPSPKAEVALVAGNVIRGTFPAADTANGQDAWIIFVTLFTTGGGINGPWHLYRPATTRIYVEVGAGAGQIPAAGGTFDIEYNDAEVSGEDVLTFDNNAPPHAEFVGWLGGIPVYISCQGPGATSPGPFIVPAKYNNIEAASLLLAQSPSPPDTIVGHYIAQGRLYLMCANTLQIATATQAIDPRIPPFIIRPFWKSGFKHPNQLIFVDGYLIGMTNHGLVRSIAEGDEAREEFNIAAALVEFFRAATPGHCLLALDPLNNAICVFSSGHARNSDGYWTTRVWMYGLRENKWIGDILLTSSTGDMIVSGAATVNGQLEFLAGGRQAAGTTVVRTYRWDQSSSLHVVPYYIAWQFSDWGVEDRPKTVKALQFTGQQFAGGTAGIHGAEPGALISVAILEAGNSGSKSGSITLLNTADMTQGDRIPLNVRNLKQLTVRIDGTSVGGVKDYVGEVVLEAEVEGARR